MQRDMELIRKILFKVEEIFAPGMEEIQFDDIKIDGYDTNSIMEHVILMDEADLFQKVMFANSLEGRQVDSVGNLSNKGYDLLDKFRDDTVWNKTKEIVKEKALPNVLEVLSEVATTVISSMTEGALRSLK